jgi:putative ABC transport system permease protein
MSRRVPLAWLQLRREGLRLAAAIAGVAFGVVLIFVQLGFRSALFDSAVRFHSSLDYGIALISPKTDTLVQAQSFPRNRIFQVLGVEGVTDVTPVYIGTASWRNPMNRASTSSIFVFGIDPSDRGFDWPGVADSLDQLRRPDYVIYDKESRPEFGPVVSMIAERGVATTEINNRQVEIVGTYSLGTSFGIDGSILTSDLNFLRLFTDRAASHVDIGLVFLEPGADVEVVRSSIEAMLPGDVDVLSRDQFIAREIEYWNGATPIGYVFGFGVIMGLIVGMVIVYQILFSDVQDSLREYATLKAMGYSHGYLVGVVMRQALLLGLIGYTPAIAVTFLLYEQAGGATNLPIEMTPERAVGVLALTLAMCCSSALLAIRKLRSAEPAEIF